MANNGRFEDFLVDTVKRIESKVDDIKDNMVTRDECSKNQEVCGTKFKQKSDEISLKKITIITGTISATIASIIGVLTKLLE
jgi:hypothetical protein